MPIVGFLNCGPTCKTNSNARPQTDLRFARTPAIILTRKARPKKTRSTRIHFTTPVSWSLLEAFIVHLRRLDLASVLAKSDRKYTKLCSINIWMYSTSQYKNLHSFYSLRCTIHAFYLSNYICIYICLSI